MKLFWICLKRPSAFLGVLGLLLEARNPAFESRRSPAWSRADRTAAESSCRASRSARGVVL